MTSYLLKILPYNLFIRIYYYYFKSKKEIFLKKIIERKNYKNLKDVDIRAYKKSTKLFVLGSGNSINRITQTQWNEINAHDIFGFNFSFLNNDHVPTYYTFEAMEPKNESAQWVKKLHRTEFKNKKETYRKVLKFVTDLREDRMPGFERPVYEDFYVLNTANGIAANEKQFEELIKFYEDQGIFDQKDNLEEVFKFRATLSMAIGFAVNMGYEEVVLCGIDLNDPRYFYQDKTKYPDLPEFQSSPRGKTHTTLVPKKLMLSIDAVCKLLYKNVLKDRNMKIFIQNPDSALAAEFPVYKFGLGPRERSETEQ